MRDGKPRVPFSNGAYVKPKNEVEDQAPDQRAKDRESLALNLAFLVVQRHRRGQSFDKPPEAKDEPSSS
ncbi:hypothetical protein Q31b_34020 [Novipirellula aureliae]|uniref:Uncharacterized protein n=1 Tax=Novipirellula aureliae TaxID=2527966 RepID=A0A5C6DTG5_9BACT|nr:hypothetical protein Q31b_34020 [Novipirellula aureliae]